jgi:hypothetical protein
MLHILYTTLGKGKQIWRKDYAVISFPTYENATLFTKRTNYVVETVILFIYIM